MALKSKDPADAGFLGAGEGNFMVSVIWVFFPPCGLEAREGKGASQKWRSTHGWETGLKCKAIREA